MVKVDGKIGKVITGASSHYVDGGGGGAGASGVSPEVELFEEVGMETEDMSPDERRDYIEKKYGAGAADALDRASQTTTEDPGAENVANSTAKSKAVSCDGFDDNTPDSTKISRYFTVGDLSSGVYQSGLRHKVEANKGLSKGEIICNLKHLAANSLDPLKDWISRNASDFSFKIGSGFRPADGNSDHNVGSAADLHLFKGSSRASREELRALAVRVMNEANIPFTQFLLEFQGGSSAGWMHVANRKNGQNSGLRIGYTMTGGAPYSANLPRSA